MKKLLFFLLASISIQAQTSNGQEQEFETGIKNNGSQTVTTAENLVTKGADGTYGNITPYNLLKEKAFLPTGLLKNGALSINAVNTTYDLSAGTGIITNFDNPDAPTSRIVTFPAVIGKTPTYLTTAIITYVGIQEIGTTGVGQIIEQATPFTVDQDHDLIPIGAVIHSNLTNINVVNNITNAANDVGGQFHTFLDKLGAFNVTGNKFTANGANLGLNKSAGSLYKRGSNFINNWKNANEISQPASTYLTFRYRTQLGVEGSDRVNLDPSLYDVGGVLTAVPVNKYTVQTVNMFQSGLARVQYGQTIYNSLAEAEAALPTRAFVKESNIALQAVPRAYVILKNTTTSLLDAADAKIIEAGKFDGFVSGGAALTLDAIISALGYTPANIVSPNFTGTPTAPTATVGTNTTQIATTGFVANELSIKEDKVREKIIYQTNFKTVTDISVVGAFTIVSTGLKSPSTGSFGGTYVVWPKQTVIDKDVTRAIVTVTNTSSIFGLIRKPSVTVEAGTKASVNGATNTITIYNGWDGSNTTLAPSVSATMPFSLVSGKKYLLELEKISSGTKTFTITDISNQQTFSITSNNEINSFSGSCWDAPGVSFESGDVTFNYLSFSSPYNQKPLIMISGDSFVEGNSLVDFGLSAYDKRWAYLLYSSVQNDAVISGRGGESSAGLLIRNDIDFFKPKYHLFLIGANDTDFNVWKTNYDAFIAKILTTGAIPILATIAPRADRQAFINQANAYIKTLPYKVINFAKAISLNNDEVTLNPAYYLADNVHPNIDGHIAMYNQVKIDFPPLFDKDYEIHDPVVKGHLTVTSLNDPGVRTVVVENGVLSSVENGITGTGTVNYIPKVVSSRVLGNSQLYDDGTNAGIGTSNPITKWNIDKGGQNKSSSTPSGGLLISDAIVGGTQRSIELGTDTDNGIGYLQARSTLSATWYALALNPNGGAVTIGDDLQVNGTISAAPAVSANQVVVKSQLDVVASGVRPYKVYTALLSQSGTNAPVATVLENTLGGTVVWSRQAVGIYTATLAGAFVIGKTGVFPISSGVFDAGAIGNSRLIDVDTVRVSTYSTNTAGSLDDVLLNSLIEIIVYN